MIYLKKKKMILIMCTIALIAVGISHLIFGRGVVQAPGLAQENVTVKQSIDSAQDVQKERKTDVGAQPETESKESRIDQIKDFILKSDVSMYTYENLISDIDRLITKYPDDLKVNDLCATFDGRIVKEILIGSETSKRHIFINGGTHANEYISSQLVMKQLACFLDDVRSNRKYKNVRLSELCENVAIHVVPMINPDGITFVQKGLSGMKNKQTIEKINEIAKLDGSSANDSDYQKSWKANAEGIDINRCYDSFWKQYNEVNHPSSKYYKGSKVCDSEESLAIANLTKQYLFDCTISYHTQGQVVFCVGVDSFTQSIADLTGYTIINQGYIEPAYSDWAGSVLSIPSLTIEVGCGDNPISFTQFENIWEENKNVWMEMLFWLRSKVDKTTKLLKPTQKLKKNETTTSKTVSEKSTTKRIENGNKKK